MTEKAIECAIYIGAVAVAAIIVVALFVSPLDAIWTAAVIFALAGAALAAEIALFSSRRRRHDRGDHGSAHSPSSL